MFDLGAPVRVTDICAERSMPSELLLIARKDGTRSALGAPLIADGEVIGALMAWGRLVNSFTPLHLRAAVRIAHLATVAIDRTRRYETLRAEARGLEGECKRLAVGQELARRDAELSARLEQRVLDGAALRELVTEIATATGGRVAVLERSFTVIAGACSPQTPGRVAAQVRRSRGTRVGGREPIVVAATLGAREWLALCSSARVAATSASCASSSITNRTHRTWRRWGARPAPAR